MNQKKKQELENEITYFREHLKPEEKIDLPPRLQGENMRRLLDEDSVKTDVPHVLFPWRQMAVAACGVVVVGLSVYFWQSGMFDNHRSNVLSAAPQAQGAIAQEPAAEAVVEESAMEESAIEESAAEPGIPMLQSAPVPEEANGVSGLTASEDNDRSAKNNRATTFSLEVGTATEIFKDAPYETSWGNILWQEDLVEIQNTESSAEYSISVSDETNRVIASDNALVLLECEDTRTNIIYYQLGTTGEPRRAAEYGQNGTFYDYHVNEDDIYIMTTVEGGTVGDTVYWDASGKEQPILAENQTTFQDVESSYYMFLSHADENHIEVKSVLGHMISAWYEMSEDSILVDNYSDSGEVESISVLFTK